MTTTFEEALRNHQEIKVSFKDNPELKKVLQEYIDYLEDTRKQEETDNAI